jgi:acyl-CoA synthetase (AMP-forming)/AMP-acid ligase II
MTHANQAPEGRPANLQSYLIASARRRGDAVAVEDPGEGRTASARITSDELGALSDRLRDRRARMGVRRGDRVGICLGKSIDSVAAIFGILKCGAAHVPVDAGAPAPRNAFILNDCSVRAVLVEAHLEGALREAWRAAGAPDVPCLPLAPVAADPGGGRLAAILLERELADPAPTVETVDSAPDDLAYILYTSGSSGRP